MKMTYISKMDVRILNVCSIKIRNRFFDMVMPPISNINDFGKIYIIFSFVMIISACENHIGYIIMAALILGLITGELIIKNVVRRRRPSVIKGSEFLSKKQLASFSFPSGHTTSSFAVFWTAWYMNMDVKYILLILAILISFSRIYLYVHYPTDILAGILLGALCAKIAIFIIDKPVIAKGIYSIDNKIRNLILYIGYARTHL